MQAGPSALDCIPNLFHTVYVAAYSYTRSGAHFARPHSFYPEWVVSLLYAFVITHIYVGYVTCIGQHGMAATTTLYRYLGSGTLH